MLPIPGRGMRNRFKNKKRRRIREYNPGWQSAQSQARKSCLRPTFEPSSTDHCKSGRHQFNDISLLKSTKPTPTPPNPDSARFILVAKGVVPRGLSPPNRHRAGPRRPSVPSTFPEFKHRPSCETLRHGFVTAPCVALANESPELFQLPEAGRGEPLAQLLRASLERL